MDFPLQIRPLETPQFQLLRVNRDVEAAGSPCDTIYEYRHPYSTKGEAIQKDITIKATSYPDMSACIVAAKAQVDTRGAAIIENAPLTDLAQLQEWCGPIGKQMSYQGGTNARKDQGKGVLSVGTEPSFANVAAHNEMSYAFLYPELFIIGCKAAPAQAGPTVIGDNAVMTDLLMKLPLGEKMREKGIRYIRNFSNTWNTPEDGTQFSNWQDVFETEVRDTAMKRANARLGGSEGSSFEWQENGALRLSYRAPAYEYDAKLERNLCFTSIGHHGYWFRQWTPFNQLPNIERPFHMQFGDGTEFTEDQLEQFVMIANASSFPLYWTPGTIVLLDNRRFTHARPPYELPKDEKRQLGVLLLNPVERRGQIEEKF